MTIHDQAQQAVQELRRVGRIVSVAGAHAVILVDQDGDPRAKTPEIGTLLRVDTPRAICLCIVSAMSSPVPSHAAGEAELRIVEVEFLGELPKDASGAALSFRRGISCYPALGDVAMRASKEELEKAYACDSGTAIRMGHIAQDRSIPAMVKVDDLLGKHFAILGATGTGKSCTLALLLRRILEKSPHGHLLLLDIHREYAAAFKDMAEVITPADLNLPFWLLTFEEIVEILIGQPTSREADIEILRDIIPIAKLRYMKNRRRERAAPGRHRETAMDPAAVGVDTPIPYRSSDLIAILEERLEKLGPQGDPAPCKRLKARLEAINRDPRYGFMFSSLTVEDTMSQVLSRLFRIPVSGKPIAIVELGGLPSEIINVVVSVLARLAFDFGIWSAGRIPLTFVCEEAHRYVPAGKSSGFEPAKRAIARIAKEGRKYGVSLGIVSQRPAELDATILSQCSTIFSMRLANERDQQILRAGVSDAAASLLDVMPAMGMGELIAFGEGVGLPARIKIDEIAPEDLPMSSSASFTRSWARELPDGNFLQDIVQRWRSQNRTPDGPGFEFGGAEAQTEAGFATHGEDIQSLARLLRQFRG
ncbi:MAG: ATP-binding protein [Aestuariivirga sp.]|uniref:ATP-binding protein n=1 Tax=Aestuariivirga sp. TaxID=2650926 RepID=UPI0038CF3F45